MMQDQTLKWMKVDDARTEEPTTRTMAQFLTIDVRLVQVLMINFPRV